MSEKVNQNEDSSPEQQAIDEIESKAKQAADFATKQVKKILKEAAKDSKPPGKVALPQYPPDPTGAPSGAAIRDKTQPQTTTLSPHEERNSEMGVSESPAVEREQDIPHASGEFPAVQREPSQSVHAADERVHTETPTSILQQPTKPTVRQESVELPTVEPISPHAVHVHEPDSGLNQLNENPKLNQRSEAVTVSEDKLRTSEETLNTKSETADRIQAVWQQKLNTAAPAEQLNRKEEVLPEESNPESEPENRPETAEIPGNSGVEEKENVQISSNFASRNQKIESADRPKITVEKAKEKKSSELWDTPKEENLPHRAQRASWKVNVKETDNSLSLHSESGLALESSMGAPLNTEGGGLALDSSAVQTAELAQNAQSAGSAMGSAGSAAAGAASGGVTVAVQVTKKITDKFKEIILESTQSRKSKNSSGSGILTAVLGFFLIPVVVLCSVLCLGTSASATNVNLSDDVLALMPLIQTACDNNGISEYAPLVAAVMMQESGGHADNVGGDVMQCAEAMGYPVGSPVPVEESINYGTRLLANYLAQANCSGVSDIPAISLAIQSYNFGGGFLSWAQARGGYTKENAEEFARQQAALMGWSSYGDTDYVDHVLRYYQVVNGMGATLGDLSLIANGMFAYPLDGYTWTTYPEHEGIDIPVEVGTPVYACANGTVIYTQGSWDSSMGYNNVASYGNCVFIDNGAGWQTRYAHLSSVVVSYGDAVVQGQLIGYSGNTGNSSGPHVHLAIYYNGSPSSGGVIYAEQAWPQYKAGG